MWAGNIWEVGVLQGEGLRLLVCKVFVLEGMGWMKQESVCHLFFCLLGNSGLTLPFECGLGNQNCSGHLSFPLIRYSRWLGSNPKIAPDIIASEAQAQSLSGKGWSGKGGRWPPRCLQRGESFPGSWRWPSLPNTHSGKHRGLQHSQ